MYRPFYCLLILLLTGCAITDGERLLQKSADSFQAERQALPAQPYIDPLTNYLIEHQGDPARTATLQQIRQERDQRCQTVARQYADAPATKAILERYNIGYGYACPEQVAEFENRVSQQSAKQESVPEPEQVSDQALSDCYLLTSIAHLFEDYDDAVKWGKMAAPESGEAAFLLGQMYAAGQGVAQNTDQAVYWLNEAAKLGNKDAEAALDQYR